MRVLHRGDEWHAWLLETALHEEMFVGLGEVCDRLPLVLQAPG